MNVHETLVAARALIDTPEKWTQAGSYGLTKDGLGYSGMNGVELSDCVCLCAIGALRCADGDHVLETLRASRVLGDLLPPPYKNVAAYNDDPNTTHADILALYDRAIESTKGESQ